MNEELVGWVESYLSDRVVIDGTTSKWVMLDCGVPQGSVLAPLLFLIFINDLPEDIINKTRMFADDTSVYSFMKNYSAEQSASLQADLERINSWSCKNLVKFNSDKVVELLIARSTERSSHPLIFDNMTIKQVSHYKHLGLVFQHDMRWETHCSSQIEKMHRALNMLKSLKYSLSRKALERAYKTFIRPIGEYMTPFLGKLPNYLMKLYESLNYEAAKLTTGALNGTSYIKLIKELGWPTLCLNDYV